MLCAQAVGVAELLEILVLDKETLVIERVTSVPGCLVLVLKWGLNVKYQHEGAA